jgi:hypothetical protein
MKNFRNIISSRKSRLIAGSVGAFLLALLIFHAGVVVGSHRGLSHGDQLGHGFRPSFFPGGLEMPSGFIQDGHGAVGSITTITLPTILMQTREGTSQTIFVGTSTMIRNIDTSGTSTLSVGDKIIVLGEPDSQNRINAKIIRILPSVPPLP